VIRNQNIETSKEIVENAIMTALEYQFRRTESCMNDQEYQLHWNTVIALSEFYLRISRRTNNELYENYVIGLFNSV
jgi:hypothetical protein